MTADLFEHADVHCATCDKTMHIRWEADSRKPLLRANHMASEAHRRESPHCSRPDLTITPYKTADRA
jgi:hypothetical protein